MTKNRIKWWLALFCLLIASPPAFAETDRWICLGTFAEMATYVDTTSMVTYGDTIGGPTTFVRCWVKVICGPSKRKQYGGSTNGLMLYDCSRDRQIKLIRWVDYLEDGTVALQMENPIPEWKMITPETLGEALWRVLFKRHDR